MTVVGAGPAGLASAIVLARAGRQVVVRDWHATVGARFHGDFQGLENWSDDADVLEELSSAGIHSTFEYHPVSGGVAFDAWGQSYQVHSTQPLYYLVHRGREDASLDRALLQQALDAGVEVQFNDRVDRVTSPAVLTIGSRVAEVIAAGYLFETRMSDGSWVCPTHRAACLSSKAATLRTLWPDPVLAVSVSGGGNPPSTSALSPRADLHPPPTHRCVTPLRAADPVLATDTGRHSQGQVRSLP